MYHAAMGAMQGQGPQEIYDRICDLLMDMQKAQWVSTLVDLWSRDCGVHYRRYYSFAHIFDFVKGLLDSCAIDQFQLCSCTAPIECGIVDEYCVDGLVVHVVSSD